MYLSFLPLFALSKSHVTIYKKIRFCSKKKFDCFAFAIASCGVCICVWVIEWMFFVFPGISWLNCWLKETPSTFVSLFSCIFSRVSCFLYVDRDIFLHGICYRSFKLIHTFYTVYPCSWCQQDAMETIIFSMLVSCGAL